MKLKNWMCNYFIYTCSSVHYYCLPHLLLEINHAKTLGFDFNSFKMKQIHVKINYSINAFLWRKITWKNKVEVDFTEDQFLYRIFLQKVVQYP